MNFQFYLEKLKDSIVYKNFRKENPKAFFAGAFLAIDIENEGKGDEQHLDFYIPSTNFPPPLSEKENSLEENSLEDNLSKGEMFSFCISNACQKTPIDLVDKEKIPEEINLDIDFDIGKIKEMIIEKMDEQGIKNKLQKILLSLQKKDRGHFLIGTVFISSFGIIKLNINLDEEKIILFEKKSIFDMIKRVK